VDSVVKITIYIIVGATVIALVQSQYTSNTITALTGGFANVLNAMRGDTKSGQSQTGAQH
jgi:hypothetical protein